MNKFNWSELKKARMLAPLSLMIGTVSAIGCLFLFHSPILSSVVMLLSMGSFIIFGFKIFLFDCPNCKNKFFIGKNFHSVFSNTCKHCGIVVGD
jgi:hypothetical protein